MKFNLWEHSDLKHDAQRHYHKWFAWYPVRLNWYDEFVWLETVERQLMGTLTNYRRIES